MIASYDPNGFLITIAVAALLYGWAFVVDGKMRFSRAQERRKNGDWQDRALLNSIALQENIATDRSGNGIFLIMCGIVLLAVRHI